MKSKEMIKASNIYGLLSEIKDGLQHIYGDKLRKVILYGSYARSEEANGSDVDLMALLDLPNVDFFDEWVDTLPYFRNVMAEGIDIYE